MAEIICKLVSMGGQWRLVQKREYARKRTRYATASRFNVKSQ
jgi:hypothetical protein